MSVRERLVTRPLVVVRLRAVTARAERGTTGLAPLDLDVAAGSWVALTPSAPGLTALDLIAGRLSPRSGTVQLAGVDLTALPPERRTALLRRSVAVVDLVAPAPPPSATAAGAGAATSPSAPPRGPALTPRRLLALRRPGTPVRTGPALPVAPLLDRPVDELDATGRAVVELAAALLPAPDVLLVRAPGAPASLGPLVRPMRDLVDLEGRTLVAATEHPALLDAADQVVTLRGHR